MAVFGIFILFAAAAAAQPLVDGVAHCTTTVTQTRGVESSSPSPALARFLSGLNGVFGDSFRLCSCEVCKAKLEIRVEKTAPRANDSIIVGIAPFGHGQRIVDGRIWTNSSPEPPKTLTYLLDAASLKELLCHQKGPYFWLDVYIKAGTAVDWMRLTVTHM